MLSYPAFTDEAPLLLYALHPWTWHVAQREWGCCATEVGQVFCHHLHVCSGKSEQLDLSCSCCRIAIVDIYRRIGGEALAQVAAGCLEEFVFVDDRTIDGSCQSTYASLAAHHGYFLNLLVGYCVFLFVGLHFALGKACQWHHEGDAK